MKITKNMGNLMHLWKFVLRGLLCISAFTVLLSFIFAFKIDKCTTILRESRVGNQRYELVQETRIPDTVNYTEYVDKLRSDITRYKALNDYFIPRNTKVNPYNYTFIIDGREICQGEAPFVLIVVPSVYNHQKQRKIVRETWGSVVRTRSWADGTKLPRIKLLFLFGMKTSLDLLPILRNESALYGDVVLADFQDSYRNLTLKMMSALFWTSTYCPQAKYLLKNDEDTFVHLPRLIEHLKNNYTNIILGHEGHQLRVPRDGKIKKWIVSKQDYPPDRYPPYILGHFYIISRNLIPKLFYLSQYIPYLSMEDVFITGIVRKVASGSLGDIDACLARCLFNKTQLAYVVGVSRLKEGWDTFAKLISN